MKRLMILLLLPVFALSGAGHAMSGPDSEQAIRDALNKILPWVPVNDIRPSPIKGVSEVQVGPRIFYLSNDGKYLLQGNLIDMKSRIDLSEERRKEIRTAAIEELG